MKEVYVIEEPKIYMLEDIDTIKFLKMKDPGIPSQLTDSIIEYEEKTFKILTISKDTKTYNYVIKDELLESLIKQQTMTIDDLRSEIWNYQNIMKKHTILISNLSDEVYNLKYKTNIFKLIWNRIKYKIRSIK